MEGGELLLAAKELPIDPTFVSISPDLLPVADRVWQKSNFALTPTQHRHHSRAGTGERPHVQAITLTHSDYAIEGGGDH